MAVNSPDRGNTVLGIAVFLITVTVLASAMGAVMFDSSSTNSLSANATATASPTSTATATPTATTTATTTATPTATPAPRNVTIRFEAQGKHVMVMATGGSDLSAVESFSVRGANMSTNMDPSADTPRAYGTVERPTTVRVTATFEDGTTQVVGERTLK